MITTNKALYRIMATTHYPFFSNLKRVWVERSTGASIANGRDSAIFYFNIKRDLDQLGLSISLYISRGGLPRQANTQFVVWGGLLDTGIGVRLRPLVTEQDRRGIVHRVLFDCAAINGGLKVTPAWRG